MAEDIKQNIILDYQTNALGVAKEVSVLSDTTEQVVDAKQKDTKATKENDTAYKSMRTQVKEATQEMYRLQEQYGLTSKEAIEATKKVAGLKDQMSDAKNIVEGFNPDRKFQGLATAVNAAAVAASGFTSGMALFGLESADTEKALLKVQAAMAFSDAVGRITEMGDDFTKLKAQIISMYTAMTTAKTVDTTVTGANTVALETNAIAENQGFLAKSKNLAITTAQTVATGVATAAQWAWNVAISANPIGALVVAIAAVVAGAYFLIKAFKDSSAESEKAEKANKALGKEIDNLSKSSKKQAEATEISQYQTMAMAKASGKSASEIRKLSEELINQEVAEKRVNAVKAYSIYLEAKRVAGLEDATDAEKAQLKKSIESYNEINNAYKDSIKEKNKLLIDNRVAEVQEETDKKKALAKLQEEAAAKELARIAKEAQEKQALKDKLAKEQLDADMKSARDAIAILNELNANNETPAQKEEREYKDKKAILEKNNLSTKELTKQHNERLKSIQDEEDAKSLERQNSMLDELDKLADADIEREQKVAEAKKTIQDKTMQVVSDGVGLLKSLFGKSKEVQKGALIVESAVGIAKIVQNAETGNAVAMASPLNAVDPTYSARARVLNTISAGIGIASNIAATAKGLQALGGGGGGSSNSAPATPSGGSVPQVGFQSSGENQIASTINQNQQAQPPVQAFVVSSEVTTAQALDRNKINSNSLGG